MAKLFSPTRSHSSLSADDKAPDKDLQNQERPNKNLEDDAKENHKQIFARLEELRDNQLKEENREESIKTLKSKLLSFKKVKSNKIDQDKTKSPQIFIDSAPYTTLKQEIEVTSPRKKYSKSHHDSLQIINSSKQLNSEKPYENKSQSLPGSPRASIKLKKKNNEEGKIIVEENSTTKKLSSIELPSYHSPKKKLSSKENSIKKLELKIEVMQQQLEATKTELALLKMTVRDLEKEKIENSVKVAGLVNIADEMRSILKVLTQHASESTEHQKVLIAEAKQLIELLDLLFSNNAKFLSEERNSAYIPKVKALLTNNKDIATEEQNSNHIFKTETSVAEDSEVFAANCEPSEVGSAYQGNEQQVDYLG